MPSQRGSEFDYKRAKNIGRIMVDVFEHSTIPAAHNSVHALALGMREDLVNRIEHQRFHHAPLAPSTVEAKKKAGLDPRILIATHEYIDAIEVEPLPDGSGYRIGVGNKVHSGSGVSMRDLARWLEFGTSKMPARPHWRPIVRIWITEARKDANGISELIKRSFNAAYLRRLMSSSYNVGYYHDARNAPLTSACPCTWHGARPSRICKFCRGSGRVASAAMDFIWEEIDPSL